MKINDFVNILNCDFYTGVPDSQLRPLCDYLMNTYGIDKNHHIIAANEGNCVAIAAGYNLATGKVAAVYMQNSGEGNIINPVASLLNEKVYEIPMIFIIGWRGEPGEHDEPQHIYQGEITLKLLDDLSINSFVIDKETKMKELSEKMKEFNELLSQGKNVAFVVKKNALEYDQKREYKNENNMKREEIIRCIVKYSENDPIVCTTGKASRELFEIREKRKQGHQYDFLTVGSMGHASSIALGIAINKPNKKIWCIDGDGAAIMHLGAMATIGLHSPKNLIHIIINNESHETVGGMPTASKAINWCEIAKASRYQEVFSVDNLNDLDIILKKIRAIDKLVFIEVKSAIGARKDLGRPTSTPKENKINFTEFINKSN